MAGSVVLCICLVGELAVVKTMAPILLGGFDQMKTTVSLKWGRFWYLHYRMVQKARQPSSLSLSARDLVFAMIQNALRLRRAPDALSSCKSSKRIAHNEWYSQGCINDRQIIRSLAVACEIAPRREDNSSYRGS